MSHQHSDAGGECGLDDRFPLGRERLGEPLMIRSAAYTADFPRPVLDQMVAQLVQ